MPKTTPEQNKALVLEGFYALFSQRDHAASRRTTLVAGLDSAQRSYRTRARGSVQFHQEPSANVAVRTGNERGRGETS